MRAAAERLSNGVGTRGSAPDFAGARETPQRRAVLEVIRRAHDHPTAAEILDRVRERQPGVGAATVYRTLSLLVRLGRVQELVLDGAAGTRFDANAGAHDHLVCVACGRVLDVDPQLPAGRIRALAADTGFTITDYELRFHGRCPDCAAPLQRGPE